MKLLIVDDERQICESMTRYIAGLDLGFQEIRTADSGVEALRICESYRPDILIVDILMPEIDGIETIERMLVQLPKLQTIIISGCHDFQYVKSALRFPVEDYVLKPVHLPELNTVLLRTIDKVMQARANEQAMERMEWFETAMPDMQERFLGAMLHGRYADEDYVKSTSHTLGLDEMLNRPMLVSVISVPSDASNMKTSALTFSALKQVLPRHLAEDDRMIWADDMLLAVLCFDGDNPQPGQLSNRFEEILVQLERRESIRAVAGIGTPAHTPFEVADSFKAACNALQVAGWRDARLMTAGDTALGGDGAMQTHLTSDAVWALKSCLIKGDIPLLRECIARLISRVIPKDAEQDLLWHARLELTRVYVKLIQNMGVTPSEHLLTNLAQLERLNSAAALRDWFESRLVQLVDIATEQRRGRSELVARWMTEQIHQRYGEQLSLQVFADETNFSVSYLSQVFSEQIGMPFLQYLTNCRMNRVSELLNDARIPISQVGAMVGYESANYFARLFRKWHGVSPSEYRERALYEA